MKDEKFIHDAFMSALMDMPMEFGSKEFCAKAREYGVPFALTRQGAAAPFLKDVCTQRDGAGTRTWVKRVFGSPLVMPKNDTKAMVFEFVEICKQHGAEATIEFYNTLDRFFNK